MEHLKEEEVAAKCVLKVQVYQQPSEQIDIYSILRLWDGLFFRTAIMEKT